MAGPRAMGGMSLLACLVSWTVAKAVCRAKRRPGTGARLRIAAPVDDTRRAMSRPSACFLRSRRALAVP
eukprot:12246689-Alexandrium_andersonii.AAC.1